MSNTDKLREIAMRIYGLMNPAFISDREKDLNGITNMLTALISEDYVEKEKYDQLREDNKKLHEYLNAVTRENNPFPDRPNPRDVNPYDSRAIKRTKRL